MSSKQPIRIAVTGAAGQITYSLLFRIAAGDMLGPDQPVALQLLEITPALKALDGVVMELQDCAFPTLASIQTSDDPKKAFEKVDIALLVGAKPRGKGMERKDLLRDNGGIFSVQGKALNDVAAGPGHGQNDSALVVAGQFLFPFRRRIDRHFGFSDRRAAQLQGEFFAVGCGGDQLKIHFGKRF